MLKKIVNKILNGDIPTPSISQWIAGFTVIVIIRSFFEVYSTSSRVGVLVSDMQRVHYFLFYVAITLMLTLTVTVFTKQKNFRVLNLSLYGFPIIFLAPTIDLILSKGKGVYMDYLFDSPDKLLYNFFTYFGPQNGITYGIRIEIFVILCAISWYVWMKRKNLLSTIGATTISYALFFLVCALPQVLSLSTINIFEHSTSITAWDFIKKSITSSGIPSNILNGSFLYESYSRLLVLGVASLFSQIFFLFSFVTGLILFWYASKHTAKMILINARPERILFFLSLLSFGAWVAYRTFSVPFTWVDWTGMITLSISWVSAWMFAVHTNDIADIDIDKISNPNRPLASNGLTPHTMREVGYIWLIVSLLGAYIVGYYPFFMIIVFTCAYYAYSAEPLRLKRIPILSSFLISLAILSTVLAGFYFVVPEKVIGAFPAYIAFGIILIFTLAVNIRDIKDVEGDRRAGINTLPVVLGRHGKKVVGALLALSFFLSPLFLPFFTNYMLAIPAALIGYWLCVRKPYREFYIFLLFFVFCVVSILLK